ncbi:hypothetical protein ACQ4PT_058664 [Festuca glaucescens]
MAFSSSSSSSWVSQLAVKATVLAAVCLLLHGGGGSGASAAELCVGHYDHTCPDAYKIVQGVLVEAHKSDPRIFASLIRLHFHDCFVLGCDGSLLLDTFPGFQSEKDRAPQQQLGARLPGRRRRQGRPREGVPRRRILRRHPRPRRRDLRPAVRRTRVGRVAGEVGRQDLQHSRRPGPTRPVRRPEESHP